MKNDTNNHDIKIINDEKKEPFYNNLTVVVPVHNEELLISSFLLKLKKYVKTIILVDDHSNDNTVFLAKLLNPDYIIENPGSINRFNSILIGLKKAKRIDNPYITILEPSGFQNFKYIHDVMNLLREDDKIDIYFAVYENIYRHYIKNQEKILKNPSNFLFFIFKNNALNLEIKFDDYEDFIKKLSMGKNIKFFDLPINKLSIKKTDSLINSTLNVILVLIIFLIGVIVILKNNFDFKLIVLIMFLMIILTFTSYKNFKLKE